MSNPHFHTDLDPKQGKPGTWTGADPRSPDPLTADVERLHFTGDPYAFRGLALSIIARLSSELAEARGKAIEECAKIAESGFRCGTCRTVFLAGDGHPDNDCQRHDWHGLGLTDIAAAIRKLKGAETDAR